MDLREKMLAVLGLSASESITILDIQKAYKELCFVWHPDRFPENMRERAEVKFKEISESYEWLKINFDNTIREEPVKVHPKRESHVETPQYEEYVPSPSTPVDLSPLYQVLSTILVLAGFFFGFYSLVCLFQLLFGGALDNPGKDLVTYTPVTLFLFWLASYFNERAE